METLDDLLALITDEDLKELNRGLLQHTKKLMEFILESSKNNLYPMVDFQIALEGALLHDIQDCQD
ncbi:hypothetical protein [Turicibacter sanguinis]|uniref:hypothetical protein n=1 Tax=Turicibacter sanguinis TaxID=154288 RepID=UPI0021D4D493|nr:hypothetical protein [Turicibacter sanguinis]MCU7192156.1 hypothetical protein [Turicibacter sanguinis]